MGAVARRRPLTGAEPSGLHARMLSSIFWHHRAASASDAARRGYALPFAVVTQKPKLGRLPCSVAPTRLSAPCAPLRSPGKPLSSVL